MSEEQKVNDLEADFANQFANFLWSKSDVSKEFEAGGKTTATPSHSKNIVKKGIGAAVAIVVPGVGKVLKEVAEEGYQKRDNSSTREKHFKVSKFMPKKKEDAQKIFLEAAVKIFRMFEYQFSHVVAPVDSKGEAAIAKLAEYAVERVIMYVIDKCKEHKSEENFECSSEFIFNAVLCGESSKEKDLMFVDGIKDGKTNELFDSSGYFFKDSYDNEKFYVLKIGNESAKYGYKKLWSFDDFYKMKEKNGEWKESANWSKPQEYKLEFSEEDVEKRVEELLNKIKMKEPTTKGDLAEIKERLGDVSERVKNLEMGINQPSNSTYPETSQERAAEIEGIPTSSPKRNTRKHPQLLKWWLNERRLIESLHERKHGDKLLVEELHDRIQKDKNRTVVICESTEFDKWSGMGGVGKTLTANWYAHDYEEHYDHILWIDCGEGSLIKSFEKLAIDLEDLDNREMGLKLEELATECFENLFGFKCLWIYDNAEIYKGKDGIIKILPNHQHFFCLITSRSREWGEENGFRKISDFQLGKFIQEESLQFLRRNLKEGIKWKMPEELKELCSQLNNLPLALQLAVAALNNSHMDVKTYIEKSKFIKVLDKSFDDYEKTINGNVKVSLDLIEKEKFGKKAIEILMIFGYIRPDDIQLEFFTSALQIKNEREIKESVKLLRKYSLVTKTKRINEENEKKIFLNIHRLLQQTIRHNGKTKEREILETIFSCEGFIDYKLLPFIKYADEDLKKEFPKVKAQLLDQEQLEILMYEDRFEECVQLSKFAHQELQKSATKWNYAICLHENGQLEECVETAGELLTEFPLTVEDDQLSKALQQMLLHLKKVNLPVDTKIYYDLMYLGEWSNYHFRNDLGDLLLFSYLRLNKFDEAIAICQQTASHSQILSILTAVKAQKKFKDAVQLTKLIDEELKTKTTKLNYAICLHLNGQVEECEKTAEELLAEFPLTVKDGQLSRALQQMLLHLKKVNLPVDIKRDYDLVHLREENNRYFREELADLLLFSYLRLNKFDKAIALQTASHLRILSILTAVMAQKKFKDSVQLAKLIAKELNTKATKLNYAICLQKNGQWEESLATLNELHQQVMQEEIKYYYFKDVDMGLLRLDSEVSREFIEGHLLLAVGKMDDKQKIEDLCKKRKQFEFIYSDENLDLLIRLVHSHLIHYNYSLLKNYPSPLFNLNLDVESTKMDLSHCSLWLDSFDRLSPEELTLLEVSFFRDGQELEEVKINDFLHFSNIKRLTLNDYNKKNLSIDISGDVYLDYLWLENVEVLNWSSCNWNVKELQLNYIPFVEKTHIKVQQMTLVCSPLVVSCLHPTIQKLTLKGECKVFVSGEVELPNFKNLTLNWMSDVGCLSRFHSAPLTHIHLDSIKVVNVDLLPPTLTHLHLSKAYNNGDIRVVGGVRRVNNLTLERFSFEKVGECLSHLHTHNLLIHNHWRRNEVKYLVELTKSQIQRIAVGEIWWREKEFVNYSSHLDREAEYYLLKGGRGRAMEREKFMELLIKNFPDDEDDEVDEVDIEHLSVEALETLFKELTDKFFANATGD